MVQYIKNKYHLLVALAACLFYGFPGKKLKIIGITGTDGKTTTSHLIHHILTSARKKTSLISSVHAEIGGKTIDTGFHVTTPGAFFLQKLIRTALDCGDDYLVLEVTSHALDQNRVWGIDFEIGVLTNVTHEHLDYHQTYTLYLQTKEKLLKKARIAILNRDDESYNKLKVAAYAKPITYGMTSDATINPALFPFTSPLPGEYNKYNCLAAIAVCTQLGISDDTIRKGLRSFDGVKGRFEYIPNTAGIQIIIDFAHTPKAIESVLSAVKPLTSGKLIHVFGSAAKRDRLKRPIMGANSARYADCIILTEEDYRDEDVHTIMNDIAKGALSAGIVELQPDHCQKAQTSKKPILFRIPNRQKAIDLAIGTLAKKGDTVILTGKAHEKSLARGKKEYPWSEHDAVEDALAKRN